MRCVKCHRPLKHVTASGLGPVCGKTAKPIPTVERDLFGYDVALAAEAATARLRVHIESAADEAMMDLRYAFSVVRRRHEFAAARRRLGVWAR